MSTDRIPASRGIASLTDIPEGECRHGPPELVIRCKHSVIPVPMLARRRDEIGEPVQELKRRELDDAVRSRSRRLAAGKPEVLQGWSTAVHDRQAAAAA